MATYRATTSSLPSFIKSTVVLQAALVDRDHDIPPRVDDGAVARRHERCRVRLFDHSETLDLGAGPKPGTPQNDRFDRSRRIVIHDGAALDRCGSLGLPRHAEPAGNRII